MEKKCEHNAGPAAVTGNGALLEVNMRQVRYEDVAAEGEESELKPRSRRQNAIVCKFFR